MFTVSPVLTPALAELGTVGALTAVVGAAGDCTHDLGIVAATASGVFVLPVTSGTGAVGSLRRLDGGAVPSAVSVAVGFVDGNTAVDVVTCTAQGSVWLLRDVCGTGGSVVRVVAAALPGSCAGVALGDIDADGDVVRDLDSVMSP